MTFYDLVQHALSDTFRTSVPLFLPELVLCGTIVLLLLVAMLAPRWKTAALYIALAGTLAALVLAAPWQTLSEGTTIEPTPIFTGMLMVDGFSIFLRCLLLFAAVLLIGLTMVSGVPEADRATEFYVLILGALLGMCLMVAANHMLMVFLAVEMASVPSYVLAGFERERRDSSEAALKYAVFGAGTAGVMLYGISLLVGTLGSAHLPTMAAQLAELMQSDASSNLAMVLVLGSLAVLVGLSFKLSAVPFHFWAPDVFEGATAEVAAFLSVLSKAAALGLLVRLAMTFATPALGETAAELVPVQHYLAGVIGLLAAVTCTFGNLAAYGQTNVKRLLAYSTIAHAGYLMMPVAAAVALASADSSAARDALAAVGFYLGVYVFMNLGAFAVVAAVRNATGSEQIDDYAGLIRTSPGLTLCFAVILFSLVGMPPLAGFAAKFAAFAALVDAKLFVLLLVGALNTVLSLFYYLRVVRVMVLQPEPQEGNAPTIPMLSPPGAYCALLTLPILVLGVWWSGLFHLAQAAATLLVCR